MSGWYRLPLPFYREIEELADSPSNTDGGGLISFVVGSNPALPTNFEGIVYSEG